MKALIDTCIIIDALQSREPFKDDAQKIFLSAARKEFDGYVTANSITDIYYLTHRYTHSDKDTRKILSNIFLVFELLDTYGLDCKKAISSDITDYEDAVMVETAIRSNMDCIVTRNIKDYSKSPIPIYKPEEFLTVLEQQTDTH